MKKLSKILAMVLTLAMLCSMLPTFAMAADELPEPVGIIVEGENVVAHERRSTVAMGDEVKSQIKVYYKMSDSSKGEQAADFSVSQFKRDEDLATIRVGTFSVAISVNIIPIVSIKSSITELTMDNEDNVYRYLDDNAVITGVYEDGTEVTLGITETQIIYPVDGDNTKARIKVYGDYNYQNVLTYDIPVTIQEPLTVTGMIVEYDEVKVYEDNTASTYINQIKSQIKAYYKMSDGSKGDEVDFVSASYSGGNKATINGDFKYYVEIPVTLMPITGIKSNMTEVNTYDVNEVERFIMYNAKVSAIYEDETTKEMSTGWLVTYPVGDDYSKAQVSCKNSAGTTFTADITVNVLTLTVEGIIVEYDDLKVYERDSETNVKNQIKNQIKVYKKMSDGSKGDEITDYSLSYYPPNEAKVSYDYGKYTKKIEFTLIRPVSIKTSVTEITVSRWEDVANYVTDPDKVKVIAVYGDGTELELTPPDDHVYCNEDSENNKVIVKWSRMNSLNILSCDIAVNIVPEVTAIELSKDKFEVPYGTEVNEAYIRTLIPTIKVAYTDNSSKDVSDYTVSIDLEKKEAVIAYGGKSAVVTWTVETPLEPKSYDVKTDKIADVKATFEGVAEVTGEDGNITIKLTRNIPGCIYFNNAKDCNFILDLNGYTLDGSQMNEAICTDHNFGGVLTITGDGTIKRGKNNLIFVGNKQKDVTLFGLRDGCDWYTIAIDGKDGFTHKETLQQYTENKRFHDVDYEGYRGKEIVLYQNPIETEGDEPEGGEGEGGSGTGSGTGGTTGGGSSSSGTISAGSGNKPSTPATPVEPEVSETPAEPTTPSESAYTDLPASDWAYEQINALVASGIVSGDGNGKIRPNDNITREEVAKIVLGANNMEIDATATFSATDADTVSDWAKGYMATAMTKGILSGYADGTVAGKKGVTRAELATMIVRSLGIDVENVETGSFTDISENAWYAKYVECAKNLGIVTGYGDGSFKGDATVTRREAFAMIARLAAYVANK